MAAWAAPPDRTGRWPSRVGPGLDVVAANGSWDDGHGSETLAVFAFKSRREDGPKTVLEHGKAQATKDRFEGESASIG